MVNAKLPDGTNYKEYDDYQVATDADYILTWNLNNIRYLKKIIDVIVSLPDLSGYYSKEEIDGLLSNKLDSSQFNEQLSQTGEFGFTENTSPYLKKTDEITNGYTEFILLTDGAHLRKNDTTYIAETADEIVVKQLLDDSITPLNDFLNEINDQVILNSNDILLNANDILLLESRADDFDLRITSNTTNINTLTSLVNSSFETSGEYSSPKGTITEGNIIRPVLMSVVSLDSNYVDVAVSPDENNFINKTAGRVDFVINFDGLQNDGATKVLALNIYKNNTLLKTISKTVNADQSISSTVVGFLDVDANDELYFTYSMSSGSGSASINNDIIYNITFKSTGTLTAVKSSDIINDLSDLPNNGLNPALNQTNLNTTNITNNTDNITKIKQQTVLFQNTEGNNWGKVLDLTESYKNYAWINIRIGITDDLQEYRIINTLLQDIVNVNDKIIIIIIDNIKVYLQFTSETKVKLNVINSALGEKYTLLRILGKDSNN